MFRNYFIVAVRNLLRQRVYSFINIFGLAVGLAGSFFILLWVMDELSHNRFLKNSDEVYLVRRNVNIGGRIYTSIPTPKPLAEALKAEYPEIMEAVRTHWQQRFIVTQGEQNFRERGNYADEAFFAVFPFPFIEGNPETALHGESSVVITDRTARKIFGEDWRKIGSILGRSLTIDHRRDFIITGVIENIPENSMNYMQFDVLLPIQEYFPRISWLGWNNNMFPIYVKLREGAALAKVNEKIADVIAKHYEESAGEIVFLQPYKDVYLYSDYQDGILVGGRIEYVRIFSAVAVFLLLIAAINFMNLATARSAQRAREIGVRKAIGANRYSLIRQFLGESILVAVISFGFAIMLVHTLLPFFNDLTGKNITVNELNVYLSLAGLGIALLVGLMAGSYPALYLSSFNPITALRGTFRQRPGAAFIRKGLVVFQFCLSVLLIVATIAVYLQIQYIRNKDWGVDCRDVLSISQEGRLRSQFDVISQEMMKCPGIANITSASTRPIDIATNTGAVNWQGKGPDEQHSFSIISANYDFIETMKMKLTEGRTFSRDFGTDTSAYIINEEMAKILGGNVLGKTIELWHGTGPVIGVVKNFFMKSFYDPIEPVIIRLKPEGTQWLYVRTIPGRTGEALASIETVLKEYNPGYPVEYEFLDRQFENMYGSEAVVGRLANVFAVIAIFISCLGLFGLVSFTTEQRTKEIGMRKVLGATVVNIVSLLSKDFLKLVLLGFVIAVPVAWYTMNSWLQGFAYRTEIGPEIFLLAGGSAIMIAILTVSWQSVRAALANPVDSLRNE